MPITDTQVAALRAQLAGHIEEHERLLDQLDSAADNEGYATLVAMAFLEAVERRFGERPPNKAEVVEFVGNMRSRSDNVRQRLSAEVAEQAIMTVYDQASLDDLDDKTVQYAQVIITVALISDEQLADDGLDAFMAEVRSVAEQVLA